MFEEILIKPILNLLVVFYYVVNSLKIPGPLGWSIILLTSSVRVLLYPLTSAQLKSLKKINELKPHLDELSKRHANDKKKLQEEQLRLYKEKGVNPAAGCLPALVQIPIFIALYNVFIQTLGKNDPAEIAASINSKVYPFLENMRIAVLDLQFLGVNLTAKPSEWKTYGWWLLLVPVITAVLQWLQTKLTTPPVVQTKPTDVVKKEEGKGDDFAKAMQTQTTVVLPLMIGFFAYSFPLGLSLYWNTFSLFGIIQQLKINKKK